MNIKLSEVIAFATGAVIGAVVAWKVVENKYERYLEELFVEEEEDDIEEEIEPESHAIEEMRSAYNNIAQYHGYLPKEEKEVEGPYIISGDEFDKNTDYNKESLDCYADGVITDIGGDVIDFTKDLIGDIDPMKHFEEHDVDTVYVRNEESKCDYEILRNERNYNDLEE